MSVLKRLQPVGLRHGVPRGQRVLNIYDRAGIGFAYHKMGDVTIDHPASPNPQLGEDKLAFAWSLKSSPLGSRSASTTR